MKLEHTGKLRCGTWLAGYAHMTASVVHHFLQNDDDGHARKHP